MHFSKTEIMQNLSGEFKLKQKTNVNKLKQFKFEEKP